MKISIFTTATRPHERGDNHWDAYDCYEELADEVIVIDGSRKGNPGTLKQKHFLNEWSQEFNWPFIGEQFQRGYEAATGDIVIHADLDFIFHQHDFDNIRRTAQALLNSHSPAMSFYKYQFILPDRYNIKSRLVVMVNKRDYGDRIKFNSGGDLCQPSLDGVELKPGIVPEAQVALYNYDSLLKTKAQKLEDVGRMDRAYKRHFGKYLYGKDGTDQSAYEGWLEMIVSRFHKPSRKIKLNDHPIFVQETIKNLEPENWGYDGHGYLERNSYA